LHLHQFASLAFDRVFEDVPYDGELPPLSKMSKTPMGIDDLTFTQSVHAVHLKRAVDAGLRLAVVPAVSNELLCLLPLGGKGNCGDMYAVRLQLRAARRFAQRHRDWYEIALDPWHARSIISQGKLAVVLSVEASNLFPEDYGDWRQQLDELYDMGVRMMFISHGVDSRFAGAAPQHWVYDLQRWTRSLGSSIVNAIKDGRAYPVGKDGLHAIGITKLGEQLVGELMERSMLLDVGHLTRRGRKHAFRITQKKRYPLVSSHCHYEDMVGGEDALKNLGEFSCSRRELENIRDRNGIVGIRPGAGLAKTFKRRRSSDPAEVPNDCGGSSKAFAQRYLYGVSLGLNQAIGSDFNGFADFSAPRFGPQGCSASDLEDEARQRRMQKLQKESSKLGTPFDFLGLKNVSLIVDFVRDLSTIGTDISGLANSAENFLRTWELAYPNVATRFRNLGKPLAGGCDAMLKAGRQTTGDTVARRREEDELARLALALPSTPKQSVSE
jgi:microsomal dipeptidase-like Zn-dependent dipeptidase